MELIGNRTSTTTTAANSRALPGRWTPFNNWMSRCALPCSSKCSVDTVSLDSAQIAYDVMMTPSSSTHTNQTGYQADVSNLTTNSSHLSSRVTGSPARSGKHSSRHQQQQQQQQQQQTPSVITDSDLPSGRSNTYFQPPHNGLVFSPGRRAQLSRQQLSWMQALAKNSINTPPSLRNAQLVHELSLYGGSMASADTDAENDATARDDVSTADVEATDASSAPQSPGSNFSIEQTRVAITQHLLTDPSSDESDQSILQSTIVDVYSLQQENTVFNFDDSHHRNNGVISDNQASSTTASTSNIELEPVTSEQIIVEASQSAQANNEHTEANETSHVDCNTREVLVQSSTASPYIWQSCSSIPSLITSEQINARESSRSPSRDVSQPAMTNHRPPSSASSSSASSTCSSHSNTASVSDVTVETTVGTSQESEVETVLIDYSENFIFSPSSERCQAEVSGDTTEQRHTRDNATTEAGTIRNFNSPSNVISSDNETTCGTDASDTNNVDDSVTSSERNLPLHLLSLFEHPQSSSGGSTVGTASGTTDDTNGAYRTDRQHARDNPLMTSSMGWTSDEPRDLSVILNQTIPRFHHETVLNTMSHDHWAPHVVGPMDVQPTTTLRSNASQTSGTPTEQQLQNWYVYDPRLIPSHRQQARINLQTQYQGLQQLWSMPAMIGPPDYDDLSTLRSNNSNDDSVTSAHEPRGPPPPYVHGGIPPPAYDDALLDALFIDDSMRRQQNPLFVDAPSSPPLLDNSLSSPVTVENSNSGSMSSNRTLMLPSDVIAQLESVLRMNSASPSQSPADTLTSCATDRSHNQCNDDISSGDVSSRNTLTSHGSNRTSGERISVASTDTNPNMNDREIRNHNERIQSLRSALGAHLEALNDQTLNESRSVGGDRSGISEQQRHGEANHRSSITARSHNRGGHPDIRSYFNRPAVMWNRSVWSPATNGAQPGLASNTQYNTANHSTTQSRIH